MVFSIADCNLPPSHLASKFNRNYCEMGLGMRSSNYRLRTIWTVEMDRYFINLMLEQVGKKNRGGDHLFSKRAWKLMTMMFNAKFNSKYEQYNLKNRHKILRNLYRAIRNLLEQKGFRWDEYRQMVTADNKDWDNYIQTHPNARPYRAKTFPYYTDLIKIYGTTGFEVEGIISWPNANLNENMSSVDDENICSNVSEYSPNSSDNMKELGCVSQMATESLHDIMIDEDFDISVAKDMINETYEFLPDAGSIVGARTRTYWQPPMDRFFLQLMLDQVNKGNHIDGLFRKHAWREMILLFNAKFRFNYGVDILKNRYKTLRKQHNVIKNLLKFDGFAWDDERQMVIADDHVWQNYIKAHTDARQYMTRPLPYFKDLFLIFRELNDEKDALSSHRNLYAPYKGTKARFITINQSPSASVSSSDQPHEENRSSDSDPHTKASNLTKRALYTPPATESIKKSRCGKEGVVRAIHEMVTAVSSVMEKRKEDEKSNFVPIERVVEAIQALPDMDEELVLDACDFLEDEKRAKTFLALDVKLRKKWLLRKLHPLC